MKIRRPRNSTLFSILVFMVSFGFWLGQPQPVKNYSYVTIPDVAKTDPPALLLRKPPLSTQLFQWIQRWIRRLSRCQPKPLFFRSEELLRIYY